MATLQRLQHQYLIDLVDACVVTKDENGNLKLHQSVNLTGIGAVSGAFWGTLIGLLFFSPLLGTAVGAAAGRSAASSVIMGSTTTSSSRSRRRCSPTARQSSC